MLQDEIHQRIVQNCGAVTNWFLKRGEGLQFPFYSSYDIRDAGWKIAPVDANIYPAGFNNICQQDKDAAAEVVNEYLAKHYPSIGQKIALLAEEHTANPYYWENVYSIKQILKAAGFDVRICWPKALERPFQTETISGHKIEVYGAEKVNGELYVAGTKIDLAICNNDFSDAHEEFVQDLLTPMNPPHTLGWYQRKKSRFFTHYNFLANEFEKILDLRPGAISVKTELFEHFDPTSDASRDELARKVDVFLRDLGEKYKAAGVSETPFCFVKNNSGTYGLAVIQVKSGDEVRSWNYKSRKRMKAAKGGRDVEELIIQEGIPTRFVEGAETAEPCVYMIGCQLVGGFLRTHTEKGPQENLNSPGAVYKRLCMSDLQADISKCQAENVYGWAAKLGVLAIGYEAKDMNVQFRNYRPAGC